MTATYLHADRLFDGSVVREHVAVAVEDGTIVGVVPVDDIPAGAAVRRYPGATITPGLIDSHVHLTPWMVFGLLAAGVTTVRDLGNDLDTIIPLLDAIDDVPLPTIFWSGPLLESEKVNWPPVARAHATGDDVRATVAELAGRGVRSIKLYYNATPEIMAAAADEAHRHGLRVLGHVGATSFDEAVAAGVDELQHLAGCLAADLGEPTLEATGAHIAAADVDHCTTLVVWQAMTHLGAPRGLRDEAMRWVHPDAVVAWAEAHHSSQPAAERVRRSREFTERMALVPYLKDAGRGILVGSDAPFPGLIPGFSLHDEAGLLVESGLTALEAMRAMTSGNAELMGISGAGTIAVGEVADLAVFEGDPTTRIADLSGILATWRGGVELSPDALSDAAARSFAQPATSPVDQLAILRYIPATVAR
ncbi:amidohydrolase family protein [Schumannella luteola]